MKVKRKLLILSLCAAFLSGCAEGLVHSECEKGIGKALPQYIGPAANYDVHVEGSSGEILNGFIKHIRIEGKEVQAQNDLLLNILTIDMDGVRYNKKHEIKSIDNAVFNATVLEPAINHFIRSGEGKKYNMTSKLTDGKIEVRFVPKVLGVHVPVSITGRPEIVNGNKINFVADKASLAKVPLPALVVNKILAKTNPIVDMSTMKIPVTLSSLTIKPGSLAVVGHTNLMNIDTSTAEAKPATIRL